MKALGKVPLKRFQELQSGGDTSDIHYLALCC